MDRKFREFGDRLRVAIEEKDTTQEQVARDVGVSLRSVQGWCLGEKEPKGRHLVRVSEVLDREPAWFYGEEKAA